MRMLLLGNGFDLYHKTIVRSITKNINLNQIQSYITDEKYPTWLIYRNEEFDNFAQNLELGMFTSFRDRQLEKKGK